MKSFKIIIILFILHIAFQTSAYGSRLARAAYKARVMKFSEKTGGSPHTLTNRLYFAMHSGRRLYGRKWVERHSADFSSFYHNQMLTFLQQRFSPESFQDKNIKANHTLGLPNGRSFAMWSPIFPGQFLIGIPNETANTKYPFKRVCNSILIHELQHIAGNHLQKFYTYKTENDPSSTEYCQKLFELEWYNELDADLAMLQLSTDEELEEVLLDHITDYEARKKLAAKKTEKVYGLTEKEKKANGFFTTHPSLPRRIKYIKEELNRRKEGNRKGPNVTEFLKQQPNIFN